MTLSELAARVERLSPSRRDPHSFFEERAEIAFALRQIAKNDPLVRETRAPATTLAHTSKNSPAVPCGRNRGTRNERR